MFTGQYRHQVDSKNRVFVPQKLRKIDNNKSYDHFILLLGPTGSLILTTQDRFEQYEQECTPFPNDPEKRREYKRYYLSANLEVVLDNQGRILIPPGYLESAGIKKEGEVIFVGMGNWIEIWDAETFELRKQKLNLDWNEMANEFLDALERVGKNNKPVEPPIQTSGD
jgi:MraZ protein